MYEVHQLPDQSWSLQTLSWDLGSFQIYEELGIGIRRRQWQPTPVFLPGETQGQGSLVAAVYGVAESWTQLKRLRSSSRDRDWYFLPGDTSDLGMNGNQIINKHKFSEAHKPYILCYFSSVTQTCLTLCHSMNCSTPGLPVHHQLPEFMQTHVHWVGDAIQPSHPLSSLSPPAFSLSQLQGLFKFVSSLH